MKKIFFITKDTDEQHKWDDFADKINKAGENVDVVDISIIQDGVTKIAVVKHDDGS